MARKRRQITESGTGALGYTRVSTEEQAQSGSSMEMQEARLRAYCQMAGLSLEHLISEEGVSAAKLLHDRPGGARLVALIDKGQVSHVVALKLDRLFRDAADALTTIREWDHSGIALHLVDMGGSAINTASPMGRMMLTVLAGFAEWERNMIAERTRAVLAHKKQTHAVYGPTPFGFRRDGDRLIEDEGEMGVVAFIKSRRSGGATLANIADELNATATPTKQGGRWFPSTILYVLNNSLYAEGA